MKKKIKITINDKTTETTVNIRNYDHFLVQLKNKPHRQTNKKVYNRQREKKVEW